MNTSGSSRGTENGPIDGWCDVADQLVDAHELLAGLQRRCGGDMPGLLAIPALLALVRKVRGSGHAQRATMVVHDEGQPVTLQASATPEDGGTRIEVLQWTMGKAPVVELGSNEAVIRQIAAAHVLLDSEQRVLGAEIRDPELEDLGLALDAGRGQLWSDFVHLVAVNHRQPLHWRLLDDARITVPPSPKTWRVRFFPRVGNGFDMLIVPDAIDSLPNTPRVVESQPAPTWNSVLGRELVPALRQPVSRIIANAETIRTRIAGPLAGEYASYANDIAEAGRHLMGLIEDLADLEAVEAPGFSPAPDHIDLADCARRASGILSVRAQERSIRFVTPGEDVKVPAIGEFRRVLQILLNLLSNAIRYSPAESTVTIEASTEGPTAWLAVTDEGEGLTNEQARRVFDKFERLGRTGDGGSGLGLYISRRLARAMAGELTVSSAAGFSASGNGARFVLSLPADLG